MQFDTIRSGATEIDVFIGHRYIHLVLQNGDTISLHREAAEELSDQLWIGLHGCLPYIDPED